MSPRTLEEFIDGIWNNGSLAAHLCLSLRSEFTLTEREEFKDAIQADLGLSAQEAAEVIRILEVEYGIN